MKQLLFLLILLLANSSFGMSVTELIRKMQQVYSDKSTFEYHCTYELFKGHKSDVVEESYKGYVYRDKSEVYQKIDETEFVYANAFFLQISNSEKMISLGQPQKLINTNVDLNSALKNCSKTQLEEKDGYYAVTLIIKNSSDLPFSVIKMRIDKKKYYLERLDIYYSDLTDFSDEFNKKDEEKSHLKITFDAPKFNPKQVNYFVLDKYLTRSNSGTLSLIDKYSTYQLIDNRLN
jgi:outer membrane lipoprotein-sorting protein